MPLRGRGNSASGDDTCNLPISCARDKSSFLDDDDADGTRAFSFVGLALLSNLSSPFLDDFEELSSSSFNNCRYFSASLGCDEENNVDSHNRWCLDLYMFALKNGT